MARVALKMLRKIKLIAFLGNILESVYIDDITLIQYRVKSIHSEINRDGYSFVNN